MFDLPPPLWFFDLFPRDFCRKTSRRVLGRARCTDVMRMRGTRGGDGSDSLVVPAVHAEQEEGPGGARRLEALPPPLLPQGERGAGSAGQEAA